jgi:phage shock protein PspC (stress-responsive transcriptional regulator)
MLDKIKSFRLANEHDAVGGVCAGIAYQLGMPVWAVRVLVFLALFTHFFPGGVGDYVFGTYLLLWFFVPDYETDPKDFDEVTGGKKVTIT